MERIFTKPGLLFLVQVDHIPGEIMGSAVEFLYEAGAENVQVIPTVTKKNRPGQIFLIDAKPEEAELIEGIIRKELGATGWHRLETNHRRLPVQIIGRDFRVEMTPTYFDFHAEGKVVDGDLLTVRPEHRSCVNLRSEISARFGRTLSLGQVSSLLTKAFLNPEEGKIILTKEEVDTGKKLGI